MGLIIVVHVSLLIRVCGSYLAYLGWLLIAQKNNANGTPLYTQKGIHILRWTNKNTLTVDPAVSISFLIGPR